MIDLDYNIAVPRPLQSSVAIISADGKYRYKLGRYWNSDLAPAIWIMLNPSTADGFQDDPTIRRCVSFATRWGFGGVEVYNLFAIRSTDPTYIDMADDPVGPENDRWLEAAMRQGDLVVLAWGECITERRSLRRDEVIRHLRDRAVRPFVLGFTKAGHPRHPLYVRSDTSLQAFRT